MKNKNLYKNLFLINKPFLKTFWKKGKLYLLCKLLFSFFSGFGMYINTYSVKMFLEYVTIDRNYGFAVGTIAFMLAYKLIEPILSDLMELYKTHVVSDPIIKADEEIMKKATRKYLSMYDDPVALNQLYRAENYAGSGGLQIIEYGFEMISFLTQLVSMTLLLTFLDWWLVVLIIVISVIQFWVNRKKSIKQFEYNQEKAERERELNYYVELVSERNNLEEIHIYHSLDYFLKKHRTLFEIVGGLEIKFQNYELKQELKTKGSNLFLELFSYVYMGIKLLIKTATVGDYVVFFQAIRNYQSLINSVIEKYNKLFDMALEAQNYSEFLQSEQHIMPKLSEPIALDKIESIEFRNVYFRYPGRQDWALENVSFIISGNEKISLVGKNGSGKTTLIRILLQMYPIERGQILINGIDISKFSIEPLWQKTAIIFQNHHMFSLTVGENVAMKDVQDCDVPVIWAALTDAGIDSVVKQYEQGLSTPLSRLFDSTGQEMSGGECQKLAAARAFYKKAPLLILDEPSSALDPIAEYELFESVSKTSTDKLCIFVSHRLSTVVDSDKIFYIENGKIDRIGTHAELMKTCPEYAKMYTIQASHYINMNTSKC
mgnify:CR=1 FL=1